MAKFSNKFSEEQYATMTELLDLLGRLMLVDLDNALLFWKNVCAISIRESLLDKTVGNFADLKRGLVSKLRRILP